MGDSVANFIKVLEAFCAATGLREATVSTKVFNDGGRIDMIRAGGDIGANKLDKAMTWLATNWPADAVWPEDVERPAGKISTVSA